MIITNARLRDQDGRWALITEGTRIVSILPADVAPQVDDAFDAEGGLIAPAFAEAHIHLDYANTAGVPRPNESGTLFEAIQIWGERKALGLHQKDDIKAKAREAIRQAVGYGVGFIRSHVDVTDPSFAGFQAIAELREELADIVDIQIVAFPQNGVYAYPGGLELVERALREGADVVGGIPHLEPTREAGVESLNALFDLAEKYGKPIDIHCDEIDDEHSRFVEVIADNAARRGMGPQTVVSHAVAMGYYSPGFLARLLPKVAASHVRFAVCPNENLHLQGLGYQNPVPRGVAPVKQLKEYGIPVSFCQDSINDPFYPMGCGDLLRILDSGLHVGHMLTPRHLSTALDHITANPAGNLGLDDYGIHEGARADFIVLDASDDKDAVQRHAEVLLQVHGGNEVFRRPRRETTWAGSR